jgi:hypothetical protein
MADGKSFANITAHETHCPIALPTIPAPIPTPSATVALFQALAAAADAPWATSTAKFEAAATMLVLPAELYAPEPRPPLDAPPPTPPPEPLPTNGYLWSAVGRTAFIIDGLDLSPTKLEELNALAEKRQAAGLLLPMQSEIAA